jgi:hypothetical protein
MIDNDVATTWGRGRVAEEAVRRFLRSKGELVLPVADCGAGKAALFGGATRADTLIAPDIMTSSAGQTRFWEVKWKAKEDWTRFLNRAETGVDEHNFQHYQRVQKETGIAVWLIFLHAQQDTVLAAPVSDLALIGRHAKMDGSKGGMRFFPCRDLLQLGSCAELLAGRTLPRIPDADERIPMYQPRSGVVSSPVVFAKPRQARLAGF